MLIKVAIKFFDLLKQKKSLVRRVLLLAVPLLLKPHQQPFELMSFESLFARFDFNPKYEFFNNSQIIEEKAPNETIFIEFTGSKEFEIQIRQTIGRMKVMTKYIKISRRSCNKHYFIKIYLKEGNEDSYDSFPLRNYQPNTELAFLARKVFKNKALFSLEDLFYMQFENYIHLTLKHNDLSILNLCRLLRYFSNLHSHYYGLYYYIPLKNGLIKAESLGKFIIGVLLILSFDLNLDFNVFTTIFTGLLFVVAPILCIFWINSKVKVIYLLLLSTINFRYAFMFTLLCYIIEAVKEIKNYRLSNVQQ